MSKYELLLCDEFSASHRLRLRNGSHEPLHGHNWRVEVLLEAEQLDDEGLVADFTLLQHRLGRVVEELQATHLNALPAFNGCNPSTELVARHIHDRLAPSLPPGVRLTKVRLWETERCAAAYIPATTEPPGSDAAIGPDAKDGG